MSVVAKRLDGLKDATWYGGGLGPGHIVLDGDPAPLRKKGAEAPIFRPISIVVKWLHPSGCHLIWR